MKALKIFIITFFVALNFSFAQTALPFTLIQQSPMLLGAGQTGVSMPSNDVLGFYYNPAILGYSAKDNQISFGFMPTSTKWNVFYSDVSFNNLGLNAGYNFTNFSFNLPITVGIGFIRNTIDIVQYRNYKEYESFNSFSLGLGFDYIFEFYLGVSLKSFSTELPVETPKDFRVALGSNNRKGNGTLTDYGALITFPISKIFLQKKNIRLSESSILRYIINFSMGYSLTNYGDKLNYNGTSQFSLFSRTARIGYTLELGTNLITDNFLVNIFDYSFTAEASDLLVENNFDEITQTNEEKYQSGLLGDLDLPDDLITLKSNDKIQIHKGHIFKFFDTFIYTTGRFSGNGYTNSRKTNGLGFTTNGIFKLLSNQIKVPAINYILNHFEFEYFNSNVGFFENYFTNFEGLSVRFKNFNI